MRRWLVRFGASQAMLDVQFWFPLWFIFLLDRGFSFAEAAAADAIFRIGVVVLELPMGALADRIGRQRAYLVLCGLTAVTFLAITLVRSFPVLIAVWLVWAVQWALASGLGAAISYDLASQLPAGTRRRVFARLRAASAAGVLASLATAGALYRLHPSVPFLLTAGLAVCAGLLASTIPRLEEVSRRAGWGLRDQLGWVGQMLTGRRTGLLFGLAAVYLLLTWSIQILYQPLALELGLGLNATALMFTACAVTGMLGTLAAAHWAQSSAWPAQLACGAVVAALCFAIGVWPALTATVFLPLLAMASAFGWTLTEYSVTDAVDHRFRATALSLVSVLAGVGIAIARPSLLIGAERTSASIAAGWWGISAFVLTGLLVVGALLWRRSDGVHDHAPSGP